MNKLKLLKITLLAGAIYFFIAGLSHFFGWSLFPFYDGALYSPYHDTLLALCDLIFVMLFLVVANNPVKNSNTLHVIIAAIALAIIFNIGIILKIDFAALGSYQKLLQTKVEAALGVVMFITLLILKPKKYR